MMRRIGEPIIYISSHFLFSLAIPGLCNDTMSRVATVSGIKLIHVFSDMGSLLVSTLSVPSVRSRDLCRVLNTASFF